MPDTGMLREFLDGAQVFDAEGIARLLIELAS
jgi:hypothetical protein